MSVERVEVGSLDGKRNGRKGGSGGERRSRRKLLLLLLLLQGHSGRCELECSGGVGLAPRAFLN